MVNKLSLIIDGLHGIPPSSLGFVCKPDMPPHINILFRARPPLPYIQIPDKPRYRRYDGVLANDSNLLNKFENVTPKREPFVDKSTENLLSIIEKNEKQQIINKERLKECKYFNIKYLW